jgi:hypothetical protein
MPNKLTQHAQETMVLAQEEAASLNHHYVGTEHILLALLQGDSGSCVELLRTMGLEATAVRAEIEKIVGRGPAAIAPGQLPLTPRAKSVIDYAAEEARLINQKLIGTEHLFLGLFREPDGVAAKVLVNLRLKLRDVRTEILKIRLLQMKIVERAVRPVRAIAPRKRKMREELLAHLSAVYEEELMCLHDPAAAMQEAARRFGAPAQLARELESSLTFMDRRVYSFSHKFEWRPPESAARYTFRLAVNCFITIAIVYCVAAAIALSRLGWSLAVWIAIRPIVPLMAFIPIDIFLLSLLYFTMRDALCGTYWSRKSLPKVILLDFIIVLVSFASCFGLYAMSDGNLTRAIAWLYPQCAIAFGSAIAFLYLARFSGPAEIADTIWASLDLDEPPPRSPEPA